MTVGVVSAPALGRRWWAARGPAPSHTTASAAPSHADCASRRCASSRTLSCASAGLRSGVRRAGSTGCSSSARACWRTRGYGDFWQYMLVAEGAVEIGLDPEVSVWDLAAPMVIVQEAGGRLPTSAAQVTAAGGDGIATNGMLHEAARAIRQRAERRRWSGVRRGRGAGRSARGRTTGKVTARPPGAHAEAQVSRWPRGCARSTLDELVGQEQLARRRVGAAAGHRGGPPALDDPARAAGQRQDHAGPPGGASLGRRVGGGERRAGRTRRGPRGDRARAGAPAGGGRRTVFFLDEIHRFNKAQQDALLPAVEDGLITLIGATTENPYFEVNSALISRTHLYELRRSGPPTSGCCSIARWRRGHCGAPRAGRRGGARVPGRALGRRRPHGAQRAGARVRGCRARRRTGHAGPRRGRAAAPCPALRPPGRPATTTRSPPGSRPPGAPTPTPRCTTWR